jgi:adenylate kinase family enzyme
VLVLTGPAGAGKTTTAQAWAAAQAVPTAHVSLDRVRLQVQSGFADPQHGWTAETRRQYGLARGACCPAPAVR